MHAVQARTVAQVKAGHRIQRRIARLLPQQVVRAQLELRVVHRLLDHPPQGLFHPRHQGLRHQAGKVGRRQPAAKTRYRRQGDEGLQGRHFLAQLLHHVLDQEIAKGDAREPGMAIADRIEHHRIDLARRRLALLHQQRREIAGDGIGQGDFNEDQRVVGEGGVKEGKAAAVFPQAAAQVIPAVDLVYRLVIDNFLQHHRRRRPVDAAQLQEALVKPGDEQVAQIGVDRPQRGVFPQQRQHMPAQGNQGPGTVRRHIDAPEQFLSRRLHRPGQGPQLLEVGLGAVSLRRGAHRVRIHVELAHQAGKKCQPGGGRQSLVAGDDLTGQGQAGGLTAVIEQLAAERHHPGRGIGRGGGQATAASGQDIAARLHHRAQGSPQGGHGAGHGFGQVSRGWQLIRHIGYPVFAGVSGAICPGP